LVLDAGDVALSRRLRGLPLWGFGGMWSLYRDNGSHRWFLHLVADDRDRGWLLWLDGRRLRCWLENRGYLFYRRRLGG